MKNNRRLVIALAGFAAGAVNGLLGAAGGMILIPLLSATREFSDEELFPASISIILPICLVSLCVTAFTGTIPIVKSIPYLLGSAAGGVLAGYFGNRIPSKWLHRGLGIMILWGGVRYLC